ncbi:iron-sulfur cluster assembly protein [Rhodothalassium salexigens DSM 2132]|uniref:Iron-sulfur cluster assembly protein n=1 Tax=Rhodothalassium salexigens DSM 2132 TaxID=1188247 RepID=A0A4R2PKV6_RHOSA|nr:iron-sulfur cluster assembly accessory protein [Rhodothalassium salexigens]MBB4211131.1 iron-sulfur cluster assembly protein [Rhodothalassium salexigens DSM 2132]MBK1637472.1 Fe-S cluster assembly scaffold SufA [Rhodothalassium salexigens DSM 2132]TCP36213.1 iron-sulfur cluster assembly protein [Rhodothalassium salexigens DSM 2132]
MATLSVTDRAAERIKSLVASRETPPAGLRLAAKVAGCSGFMYDLQFVDEADPGDAAIDVAGTKVFLDPASAQYLNGVEMDWQEDRFTTGFTFSNPNAKSLCGCGESFHV